MSGSTKRANCMPGNPRAAFLSPLSFLPRNESPTAVISLAAIESSTVLIRGSLRRCEVCNEIERREERSRGTLCRIIKSNRIEFLYKGWSVNLLYDLVR
jgi:hypothetical protein